MDGMRIESPWDNHIDIAIKVWARDRARQLTEEASKVPAWEMEWFLTEVLIDALRSFNKDYNSAYNGHVHQLEQLMETMSSRVLAPPSIFKEPLPQK